MKTAEQIFKEKKSGIPKIWDSLAPLQRSKAFHMKPTCLFVFHTWDELDARQKEIVFNAVRIIIENEIVKQEIGYMINMLRRML